MYLYHGTPGEERGRAILQDGLRPNMATAPETESGMGLAPAFGRIYLSQDPLAAAEYARMRDRNDWAEQVPMEDATCYLFEVQIPENEVSLLVPDEDQVGEALFAAFSARRWTDTIGAPRDFGGFSVLDYGNEKLCAAVNREPALAHALRELAQRNLEDRTMLGIHRMDIENPDGVLLARAGRELLLSMPTKLKQALIDRGAGVSMRAETIPVTRAWYFDRNTQAVPDFGIFRNIAVQVLGEEIVPLLSMR